MLSCGPRKSTKKVSRVAKISKKTHPRQPGTSCEVPLVNMLAGNSRRKLFSSPAVARRSQYWTDPSKSTSPFNHRDGMFLINTLASAQPSTQSPADADDTWSFEGSLPTVAKSTYMHPSSARNRTAHQAVSCSSQ